MGDILVMLSSAVRDTDRGDQILTRKKLVRPKPLVKSTVGATNAVPKNRLHRARMRTRQKLIEAAQRVMGENGVEAATIAQIASAADVGFGSFYNHFSSKEQIANEVFAIRAEVLARELEFILHRVPDIAFAVSLVQRWFIERGTRDPVWGWFVIHADAALQQMEFTFRERVKRDIQHGVTVRRFDVRGIETAATMTISCILAVMRRVLEGKAKPTAANEMVEGLLRMYGVAHAEAHKLAREPFPVWIGQSMP